MVKRAFLFNNRPDHVFSTPSTVLVWESDGKELFQKLNFAQVANHNFEILSRRMYSPSLKEIVWLEDAQLTFLIFRSFVCRFCWVDAVQVSEKKNRDKL